MKRILGLDLGTNSIGWALVDEASSKSNEESKIIKLGVRVNPLTVDEKANFEKGKPISTNADRTLKRGARRNLQRYKLRREHLSNLLLNAKIISQDSLLTEIGKNTTHQTLKVRAKAAKERIELDDGDFIDLAWCSNQEEHPIIIILHGVTGNIDSPYMKYLVPVLKQHQQLLRSYLL